MPPDHTHWHVHETKHLLNQYTNRINTGEFQNENRVLKLVSKDLRDIGCFKSAIECKLKLQDLKYSFRRMIKTSCMVDEMNNAFSGKKLKKSKEKLCGTCTGSSESTVMTNDNDDSTMQNDKFDLSYEHSSSNNGNYSMQMDIKNGNDWFNVTSDETDVKLPIEQLKNENGFLAEKNKKSGTETGLQHEVFLNNVLTNQQKFSIDVLEMQNKWTIEMISLIQNNLTAQLEVMARFFQDH